MSRTSKIFKTQRDTKITNKKTRDTETDSSETTTTTTTTTTQQTNLYWEILGSNTEMQHAKLQLPPLHDPMFPDLGMSGRRKYHYRLPAAICNLVLLLPPPLLLLLQRERADARIVEAQNSATLVTLAPTNLPMAKHKNYQYYFFFPSRRSSLSILPPRILPRKKRQFCDLGSSESVVVALILGQNYDYHTLIIMSVSIIKNNSFKC